jgi:microcystin-dependent protein
LPLSHRFDSNGNLLPGCRLFIFDAGTTTPADTFPNSSLTAGQEQSHPLVADSAGMIPDFWVADGSYRARLTTATGILVFDRDNMQSVGPSSGEGGGGDSTPEAAIFKTGEFNWQPISGTRSGWVRANARTIGSASSGASERANSDCQPLFEFLWNGYSDTICPVAGGRGANAAADWAADKAIGLIDMRGRAPVGLADMGNSDSGRLDNVTFATGSKTAAASVGGAAFHTLTEAQMPERDHTASSVVTDPGHFHRAGDAVLGGSPSGTGMRQNTGSGTAGNTTTVTTGITVATTVNDAGDGDPHPNMQPFMLGTWFIRL